VGRQNTQLTQNDCPRSRNIDVIFEEHLTFSGQILSLSKSCYYRRLTTDARNLQFWRRPIA